MTPLLAFVVSCPLMPWYAPALTFGAIAAALWGLVAYVDGVLPPPSVVRARLRREEE